MTYKGVKSIVSFILLMQIALIGFAQSPKREMRSTWLATVYQLDWPKSKISSTGNEQEILVQKKVMTRILDSLVSANMNAVCFQVRSRCDAMYKSSYEPWSSDLVATRGMDPGYDPLAFVVEEGHKRGLEVHAWVNPYRFESVAGQWSGLAGDYNTTNPDWVLTHGTASILNPGIPAVRERITNVIKEIVSNYNVDGVLFDDYFYLQGTTEDADTYNKYNSTGLPLGDWRRNNVNMMIAQVYKMIQEVKPYVRFGVSPAGIWDVSTSVAESYGLTLPTNISGGFAYNGIFCDPIAWLQQGTIDYISPQIYWTTGSSADYNILAPWWSDVALHFGKHFYSSHSISALDASIKVAKKSVNINGVEFSEQGLSQIEQAILRENNAPRTRAFGASEVGLQIDANRTSDKNDAPGSIFYSTTKLYATTGFVDYLKRTKFTNKALLPAIHWKRCSRPMPVTNISQNGNVITWNSSADNVRYSVYAIPATEINNPAVFNSSRYLLGISYTTSYVLSAKANLTDKVIAVAIFDRYGNEYSPVIMGQSAQMVAVPEQIFPANSSNVLSPFTFAWKPVPKAMSYILELAPDEHFDKVLLAREIYSNSFSTTNFAPLKNGQRYYWRVRAKGVGFESELSSVKSFIPTIFSIVSPVSGSKNVSLVPQIAWTDAGVGATYKVEIATTSTFVNGTVVYTADYGENQCQLPNSVLVGLKTYYLRVCTPINGVQTYSSVVDFTTGASVPNIPIIDAQAVTTPELTNLIKVTWKPEPFASNFRVELSNTNAFYPRQTKAKQVEPFIYETSYEGLTAGIYFVRARANYSIVDASGTILPTYTDWSNVVRIENKTSTGIDNILNGSISLLNHGLKGSELLLNLLEDSKVVANLYTVNGVQALSLYSGSLSSGMNSFSIPTFSLSSGVYILVVETNGKKTVFKIIK